MTFVTDEKLMAYSDGELPAEECRELESMLARDSELRRRLGPFALTGAPLADIFSQPMREPVPERLVAAIRNKSLNGAAYTARAAQEDYTGLGTRLLSAVGDFLFPNGMSGLQMGGVAASLLAGVVVAGWMLGGAESGNDRFVSSKGGVLVASGALARALETQASGAEPIDDGSGARIIPTQTFRSRAQQFCREYEMADADGRRSAGLACRTGKGEWRVAFHGDMDRVVRYGTAGEGRSPALEEALKGLRDDGNQLTPQDESRFIAGRWATSSR